VTRAVPPPPLLAYALLAAADLVAVAARVPALELASKPLLALALAWYLRRAGLSWRDPMLPGLVLACLGDTALLAGSPVAFLAGLVAFLGMQVCYLVAMRRRGARPGRVAVIGYAVLWLGLGALLWPRLGPLGVPVLGYGAALVAMAATATGLSVRAGVGGAVFVASDLMIGTGIAGLRLPLGGVAVMLTYILAQYLLVTGYRAAATGRDAGPAVPAVPDRSRAPDRPA